MKDAIGILTKGEKTTLTKSNYSLNHEGVEVQVHPPFSQAGETESYIES